MHDAVSMIVTNLNMMLQLYKLLTKVNSKGKCFATRYLGKYFGQRGKK